MNDPSIWARPSFPGFGSWKRLVLFVAALAAAACGGGGSSSPTEPTPPAQTPASVSGTWTGNASDSSGPGQMSWQLNQSGSSFSGNLTMTDMATGVIGHGSISGSVSGTSIQFSISVPSGGFDNPYGSCNATATGTGQVSSPTITGTYSGSNSCSGTVTSGQLTLTKQ